MASDHLSHSAEAALRERVKELTCLYDIAQIAARPGMSLEEVLRGIVEVVRRAWQYPEITCARISLDGRAYLSEGFREGPWKQAADVLVGNVRRGSVEVFYLEERREADEGPFLKEERKLIDAVAVQVALVIERREAEVERSRIQDQLRHADRLATIGQLAAGVAHELNEPLGGILGLAQLATRPRGVPRQTREDIEKIKAVCLEAREVIKKLLVFARQFPAEKVKADVNQVVEGVLDLLEARCGRRGVDLVLELTPDLPEITCDPAQINQALVNLAVNALQAMPKGGRLKIQTEAEGDSVRFIVQDTGIGMTEEVLEKVFVPFFTTKEVGEGTGLGLPVVHGIVTSHRGSINIESQPGQGTRVEVELPVAAPTGREEES